jgi:antitoxin component of MazEF toxin-antitoxin module
MEERTYVEDRSFRKLLKLGGSLVVSLPKKWTENYKLTKESLVAINLNSDGSLRVTPELTPSKEVQDDLILESSPYVVKDVVMNILSGQTKIIIVSDKVINKSLRNQIRYWVEGLPNTEITEEMNQRIVIQNFGYKMIPTHKLIQRLLYLITDMFDDVKNEAYDDLNYNFDQLRKFYFILVMHIRAYLRTGIYVTEDSDFTPLESMDYRIFCGKVEEIGKILKRLRLTPIVMPFFNEIHHYFKEVMDAYLKRDSKVSYYLWLKKYQILDKANYLLDILEYKDHDKIRDMIGIAERCKDMAGLF